MTQCQNRLIMVLLTRRSRKEGSIGLCSGPT